MKSYLFVFIIFYSLLADAKENPFYHQVLSAGFSPVPFFSEKESKSVLNSKEKKVKRDIFCQQLAQHFRKYGWQEDPCGNVDWKTSYWSQSQHPLLYAAFGHGDRTTLIFSGVHPDELTPIPMGFKFAKYLAQNPNAKELLGAKVVVAPLVNPDGFLRNVPSRGNARGVDLNRNFLTLDWHEKAYFWWQNYKRRNPRHFPGYFPNSEAETLFQIHLIEAYRPDKILSIHAPLGFLDYDGPADRKRPITLEERRAKGLARAISKKSKDYRIVDYSFFPGSLGNYAGNERRIPTITLELKSTDASKVNDYWIQFLPGLLQSVEHPFRKLEKSPIRPSP